MQAIKTLDPSRYFRNRSRQSVREVHKRFSALMRRVARSRQDEQQPDNADALRGLTMLVKGLHVSMNEMRATLLDVQERLSNQEAARQADGSRRPEPRVDKEDEAANGALCAAPRPHATTAAKASRWRPAAIEIEQGDAVGTFAAPARASRDARRQVHMTSRPLAPSPSAPVAPVTCEDKSASAGDVSSSSPSRPGSLGEESAGKVRPQGQMFASAKRAESRMDTSSSSDGNATEEDSQCERPQMIEAASTRPSPVWQEKADEFLKQNVVQNFYT